jgi:hypothetical protein
MGRGRGDIFKLSGLVLYMFHQWDVAKGGKGHIQIIMVMINLTHADGNIMFIHAKLIAHRIKKIIQCKKYARISW